MSEKFQVFSHKGLLSRGPGFWSLTEAIRECEKANEEGKHTYEIKKWYVADQYNKEVWPKRRRRVLTTYQVVTDESAESGDYAEIGWLENGHKSPIRDEEGEHPENVHRDHEGVDCEVDSDEAEDGLSAMKKAAAYIQDEGGNEPSSSHFSPGTWYSTESQMDMHSGDYEGKSFHLYGFTEEEEKEVWDLLHSGKRLRY